MTFDAAAYRASCRTRTLGHALDHFPELDSTSAYLKRRARSATEQQAAPPAGLVVLADTQTAGYGQHGRSWISRPGQGLYCSVWLPSAIARHPVTLLAGVALVEALRPLLASPEIGLKWVNDLVARGRKLGGILAEGVGGPAHPSGHGLILGIGLNLADPGIDEAIGLATLGPLPPREALLAALMTSLESWLDRLPMDASDLPDRWTRYSVTIGQRVTVQSPHATVTGLAEGITAHGSLLIRQDDGSLSEVLSGTVRLADGRYC